MTRLGVLAVVLLLPGRSLAQPVTPPPLPAPEILAPDLNAPAPAYAGAVAPVGPGGRQAQNPSQNGSKDGSQDGAQDGAQALSPDRRDDRFDAPMPPGSTDGQPPHRAAFATPPPTPAGGSSPAAASATAAREELVITGDQTVAGPPPPARPRLVLPSLSGSVGLVRISAAEVGETGDLRLGLTGEYASAEDFLVEQSRNRRLAGTLTVAVTAARWLELFGALLATSNRNDRCVRGGSAGCAAEAGRSDPAIIRAFGDLLLGGKAALPLSRSFRLGGELGTRLYAGSSSLAFAGQATSWWLSGLGTVDLRRHALPLLLHLNAGLFQDNSSALQDGVRFAPDMLASRSVSTFAYGIGRDRLRGSLGLSAPIDRRFRALAVEPLVEYHLEVITAPADPAYRSFTPPNCVPGGSCADNRDQHWLTFGLRAQTGGGFALFAGLDLGLRSPGYAYGSALLPYNVLFGLRQSVPLGGGPPRTLTRTITLERRRTALASEPAEAGGRGWIAGRVSGRRGEAIAGAALGVVGGSRTRVATDLDGGYVSKALPPGAVQLEISAPGYEPQILWTRVSDGRTTALDVTLEASGGRVQGVVADPAGKASPGVTVRLEGPVTSEVKTDAQGAFAVTLPPGSYLARAETAEGRDEQRFQVAAGVDRQVELHLRGDGGGRTAAEARTGAASPGRAGTLRIEGGRLVPPRPIVFAAPAEGEASAALDPRARRTLDALAGPLGASSVRIRVEAHWDNALPREQAEDLTRRQAEAVVEYLVARGVPRQRLEPAGLGASRPRVPNIGPTARAKNRRVELVVLN